MPHAPTERRARGFTLIELLIIMIILGLLVSLVAPRLIQKVGTSKVKAAKTQISMMSTALDAFRLDVGRYPTTDEGLKVLVENPGLTGWEGPYLAKKLPGDPWNKPYEYRSPGEHGAYDVWSLGADGAEGGEGENADITSWE